MTDFDASNFLEHLGLRATRPRLLIARILFADGKDRHVTAEWLAEELAAQRHPVALATVYNTLHALTEAGALREVNAGGPGTILFDTHTGPHHHFFDERTGELTDIPAADVRIAGLPEAPAGKSISGCEVIVRIR